MNFVKVILVFSLVLICIRGYNQTPEGLDFSPPFDSASVEAHQEAINKGASYLLVIPASVENSDKKLLLCTSWLDPRGKEGYSYGSIDSLLNKGKMTSDFLELIPLNVPIQKGEILAYKKFSTCQIVSAIFTSEGVYSPLLYYYDYRSMLAVLLERGIRISVLDYDGDLAVDLSSLDCD